MDQNGDLNGRKVLAREELAEDITDLCFYEPRHKKIMFV
jgi:hypothetical protein